MKNSDQGKSITIHLTIESSDPEVLNSLVFAIHSVVTSLTSE